MGALRSSIQCIDVQLEGWKLASGDKKGPTSSQKPSSMAKYSYLSAVVMEQGKGPKMRKTQQDAAQGSITGRTNPLETHSLGI